MRQSNADKFIDRYCTENGLKLLIDPKLRKNDGLCYPSLKEIHLAPKYTSGKIKIAIFLHEVAHIRVDRFKNKPYSNFDCEYYSWFEAIKIHRRYFGKSFNKAQAEMMLKCLKTYCRSHYEFREVKVDEDED